MPVGDSTVLTLIMIGGAAGTGKTSLAGALAPRLGASVVDLDDVTASLVQEYLASNPEVTEALALSVLRDARYALLAQAAAEQTGLTIAVAPFSRELASAQDWSAWVRAAGRTDLQCRTLQTTLPAEEHLRRLQERGAARDAEQITLASLPATIVCDATLRVLVVDASAPVEQLVETMLPSLTDAPAGFGG